MPSRRDRGTQRNVGDPSLWIPLEVCRQCHLFFGISSKSKPRSQLVGKLEPTEILTDAGNGERQKGHERVAYF